MTVVVMRLHHQRGRYMWKKTKKKKKKEKEDEADEDAKRAVVCSIGSRGRRRRSREWCFDRIRESSRMAGAKEWEGVQLNGNGTWLG